MTNVPHYPLPTDFSEESLQVNKRSRLLQKWLTLTALPDVPASASFAQREAVRKSQLTSNVLFFFTTMVVALLPALYFSPYRSHFWLDLGLVGPCIFALVLNRKGLTLAAGILVISAGFTALTLAIFSTVPFDETTLQAYDMYVIADLLAVSLLPPRSVFLVTVASIAVFLITLFTMPHTAALNYDLSTRLPIIVARPIGTLFLVGGVSYILAQHLTTAIGRASRAEAIAKLEHALAEQSAALQQGVQQILETHVAVANGNYGARAPLSEDNLLWQISRALNTLLVRHQRAVQAEQQLKRVEQAVANYVTIIRQARKFQQQPILPFERSYLDPLVAEMQGMSFGWTHSTVSETSPSKYGGASPAARRTRLTPPETSPSTYRTTPQAGRQSQEYRFPS
ncbi:MAG: hypothetical protein JO202_03490 [Ktedonobacteraceae bacterium]|nr:hypothetical protein [Ktedonobacteraceae bacterium]